MRSALVRLCPIFRILLCDGGGGIFGSERQLEVEVSARFFEFLTGLFEIWCRV